MTEHYDTYAGDTHRRRAWLLRLPLIVAALLAIPLVWISLLFSWNYAEIASYVFQLGTDGWTQFLLVLMVLTGPILLIACLVFLFIGSRRATWKWRIGWAVAALLAAGGLPLSWLFMGYFN